MRSRRGLGVLVICGLALGAMSISASGAQAGQWMVNGANVKAGVELKASFGVEIDPLGDGKKHLLLLAQLGSNRLEFLCAKAGAASATFTTEVLTTTFELSECQTFFTGTAIPGCNPINQPIKIGVSATPVLHEKKSYVKIKGVLVVFKFDEESCGWSPVQISGTLWLEDCKNELEAEKSMHLFQEAKIPAEQLGGLLFGSGKAAIDGSFTLTFNDAFHAGLVFSGLAE